MIQCFCFFLLFCFLYVCFLFFSVSFSCVSFVFVFYSVSYFVFFKFFLCDIHWLTFYSSFVSNKVLYDFFTLKLFRNCTLFIYLVVFNLIIRRTSPWSWSSYFLLHSSIILEAPVRNGHSSGIRSQTFILKFCHAYTFFLNLLCAWSYW